ncbi:SWIM zinc finger family protein [Streptomyces sp. Q6]|uniref:SWIM zinc finger family protein n=1 Tax=Streptomyces citrinus TaxID=3118173 RepID=A0ACD5AGT9_9ACTN
MTQQGVRWTADQVLALAPDAASRKAGSKLGTAGPWSQTGSSNEGAVWGQCKGSGSKPYQTIVDMSGAVPAYKCSCPSRKFPCKHALGLLLLRTAGDTQVPPDQTPPDWAEQWLEPRRKRAHPTDHNPTTPTTTDTPSPADPEAARRRAERRAQRITSGTTELEQRLADLLRGGLAQTEQAGYGLWEEAAARMVDAQAPGLASRIRELGAIPATGPGWPVRLLEECALLHLLNQGWLHRERLPPDLATTVRTRVGLPPTPTAPPIRDRWLVLSQYDTTDGHLTTRRIWLYGTETTRTALLLSYGAAGRAPSLALPPGQFLDADIRPHPGAAPLRADLHNHPTPTPTRPPQTPPPTPPPTPTQPTTHPRTHPTTHPGTHPRTHPGTHPAGVDTTTALTTYGTALSSDPWLESWPVTLGDVIPVQTSEGDWQLADAEGKSALPLTPQATAHSGLWRLVSLSGGTPITVFGECGHKGFTPLSTWTREAAGLIPLR